ncbi:hypothetical protein EGW08_014147 [Elysia chlorotica]|uniref:Laminin EGF-like domain-containing protein n=1 Tax=Elysia chlorotica TaxID=188477 RepID=A0A433T926_ELYCH|nr:hypothetical protein EGW08_014147 [Elysia chlorotica]
MALNVPKRAAAIVPGGTKLVTLGMERVFPVALGAMEDCFVTNVECPDGFYGGGCSKTCNENCREAVNVKLCDHRTGACLSGCVEGYQGSSCDEVCKVGTYGVDCAETCNPTCGGANRACDHLNGTCLNGCADGYRGEMCDIDCPDGSYGAACSKQCSQNCAGLNNSCQPTTGACRHGCEAGFGGPACNIECSVLGPGCSTQCSPHCGGPNDDWLPASIFAHLHKLTQSLENYKTFFMNHLYIRMRDMLTTFFSAQTKKSADRGIRTADFSPTLYHLSQFLFTTLKTNT